MYHRSLNFDIRKSISELDKSDWIDSDFGSSLVNRCQKLRNTPLSDFLIDDFRVMIGQNIGLEFLIPLSLDILGENPLAEGNYYKGDLLSAVLSIKKDFWRKHDDYWWELKDIIQGIVSIKETIENELEEKMKEFNNIYKEYK